MSEKLKKDQFRNVFTITVTGLGLIALFLGILYLMYRFNLIFSKKVSDEKITVFTETGVGTQPIINPSSLIKNCGNNICNGINFQKGWSWCNKCGCLFLKDGLLRNCYAGGLHSKEGSGNYELNTTYVRACNTQSGWKLCSRCSCLVDSRAIGRCFDKNQHNLNGSADYYLCTGNLHGQCGWKWCKKCSSMFYAPSYTHCYDGELHDGSDSVAYQINTYKEEAKWIDYPLIFGDLDCPSLGKYKLSLSECQTLCDKTKGCTAVNYSPEKVKCDLRKCKAGKQTTWYEKGSWGFSRF